MLVAYRKATIALADEVLFLDDGRIADRGTHAELLGRNPAYARLVNAYEAEGGDARRAPLTATTAAEAPSIDTGEEISALATIRRGLRFLARSSREGFGWTLLLALIGTAGRVVVPIAVQQTLDRGLNGPRRRSTSPSSAQMACWPRSRSWSTGVSSYLMTARLFTASERGLATLRIKAFRHVHDLPLLTQNTERRGALVSRVTSDVDQVSQFLVFGGIFGIVSVGQVLVATVVMLFY